MNEQNEVTLDSWEEFEDKLCELDEFRKKKQKETGSYFSKFIYRGQPDSRWKLETTLDRVSSREITLLRYYILALRAQPRIESFTDKVWDIPTYEEYKDWLIEQEDLFFMNFKAFDYLAYLRHHGFPSPLLDWTASPYVAIFFAMNKVGKEVDHVSVYAFMEYSGRGKSKSGNDPAIDHLESNVKTHKRHFMQQSEYTICTKLKSIGEGESELLYASHEDVIFKGERGQDLLWKFNISTKERLRILQKLQTMNINSFSLFGTEDSLMDSLATEEFLL